jgi:hypothetical protein
MPSKSSMKTDCRRTGFVLKSSLIIFIGAILIASFILFGCTTDGAGTGNVTCETINYVYLSHKDTKMTIEQVVQNNGALSALGCKKTSLLKSLPPEVE